LISTLLGGPGNLACAWTARLSSSLLNGSLIISALFGAIAGSWAVFWITLAVTFVGSICAGEIRPQAGRR
jgi:hypothetical protein